MSNKKNRIWLAVMMVLVCFLLTACGCKHEETAVINTKSATCTHDGYTGDTQCLSCEKIIAKGETIPAAGHTKGNPINVAEATCTTEGYTGDVFCITCGELLTKGEAIARIAHTPDDVHNAAEATCAKEGYTGDVFCKVCGTMLSQGQTIATLAHTPDEIRNAAEATCAKEGYTGDVLCKVCGEVLERGTATEMLPHTPEDQPKNASVPTCTQDGYSGDIYCSVCSALVTSGSAIPATGHSWGEATGVVEPTCLKTGYSGDRTCTVCGTVMKGEVLAVTDHNFENNVCTICAWPVPGYYADGELVMTWEELKANGYIAVSEGKLTNAPGNFSDGTLVIGEDVTIMDGFRNRCENIDASEIWLPRSMCGFYNCVMGNSFKGTEKLVMTYCVNISEIPYNFARFGDVKEVILPNTIKTIANEAFFGCNSLERINLPEGLTSIGSGAFNSTSIKEVTFPSTIKEIRVDAFYNSPLEKAILPDGIQYIAGFDHTNLKELTMPSSVLNIEFMPDTLRLLDLSNAILCDMNFNDDRLFNLHGVGNQNNRLTLKLPPHVNDNNTLFELSPYYDTIYVDEIKIPSGIKTVKLGDTDMLSIVIPTSVTKVETYECTIGEIKYCGSEQQWRMIGGSDQFAGIPIEFNYNPEEAE